MVGAGTLLDGNPLNNYLERAATFNPDGLLCGARAISFVGTLAYVCCDAGLVVVNLADPLHPQITSVVGQTDNLNQPRAVTTQFRYAFVTDCNGVSILDITDPAHPHVVQQVPLEDARQIYAARTYAYVAAGRQGLVILDITRPDASFIDQVFNGNGCINDAYDVQLGIANASQFAYVADGRNGLRVVQLAGPEMDGNDGFSPRPQPQLIATYHLRENGRALAISRGMDRDRAVDESGNQLSVFGRIGARPLNLEEARRMFRRPDGQLWWTSDDIFDPQVYNTRARYYNR